MGTLQNVPIYIYCDVNFGERRYTAGRAVKYEMKNEADVFFNYQVDNATDTTLKLSFDAVD
jgi:hypothetical protein